MISRRPSTVLACAVVVVVTVLSGLSWPAVAAAAGKSQLAQLAKTSRRCPRASYGAHFYAPGRGKTVALTFDDGPGRSYAEPGAAAPDERVAVVGRYAGLDGAGLGFVV